MLVASLQEVGFARSIVLDENNRILAGNGTVEAAAELGMDRVKVVDADGETIVAVRRTGLTEEQKRRLSVLDNRTGELADWDTDILAGLVVDGLDITDLWAPDEFDRLLSKAEHDFAPNLSPMASHMNVQAGDIATAASDMQAKIDGSMPLRALVCPKCGGEFFLTEDVVKLALRNG